jgi:hypothetical protein
LVGKAILRDALDKAIKLKKNNLILRRIGLNDKEAGRHYKFMTNNFMLAASTIGLLYKNSWAKRSISLDNTESQVLAKVRTR